jgi:peptidoglycan hydrolase-like protein with peptidoglycan-binding domain
VSTVPAKPISIPAYSKIIMQMLGGVNIFSMSKSILFYKMQDRHRFINLVLPFLLFVGGLLTIDAANAQTLTLQRGMVDERVTDLQIRLREAGYYNGPIDGAYGEATEAAVIQFQESRNLAVDGIAGSDTLAALGGEQYVGQFQQPSVANLQIRLREAGYYNGPINGTYGEATEAAVRQFQQDRELEVDGIAGPNTLAALAGSLDVEALRDELQNTDRPLDISNLQRRLLNLEYDVTVDGIYGPQTQEALIRFALDYLTLAEANQVVPRFSSAGYNTPIQGGTQPTY